MKVVHNCEQKKITNTNCVVSACVCDDALITRSLLSVTLITWLPFFPIQHKAFTSLIN